MDKQITISLVSNAGVLIQGGGYKILLDALWTESGDYSPPPACLLEQLFAGEPDSKWRNADILLFSHVHKDHFAPDVVIEYLRHNKVHSVWFEPQERVVDSTCLIQELYARQIEHVHFELDNCEWKTHVVSDDLTITNIRTSHMGIHAHEKHDALLLQIGGKNLLFVADAEFPETTFKQAVGDIQLDAVFLNPVHFYSRRALEFLVDELRAKMIVVYHIPFEGEGNSVFRRMVSKKLPTVAQRIPVRVLWNVGDGLDIG